MLLKFLKKKKLNSKIIGGYYPFNHELDILNILEKNEIYNSFKSPLVEINWVDIDSQVYCSL